MKVFKCQNCKLLLFFENSRCERCGHTLGYSAFDNELITLNPQNNGLWQSVAQSNSLYKFCDNAKYDACNWLIPSNSADIFCIACRHNHTVPDLSDPDNLANWHKLEFAKHRLFYTLLRLRLPMPTRAEDPNRGLIFDFLADPVDGAEKVLTGHDDGIITLALKEADDAEREKRRTAMHEPYRTLLGHFRHEIGHFYWNLLVDEKPCLNEYRSIFGDEREDYSEALKRYYDQGAPANWQEHFISVYATSHSWEDFAETWAHYLHIMDTLETSKAFGLEVHPDITSNNELHAEAVIDPFTTENFETLIKIWLPLTYAMNAMNRSMGLMDIYPFVISPAVINKLAFIHRTIRQSTSA